MSLPAFASVADLAARTPGGIPDDDEERAQAVLDDASSKIRAEAGESWVTDGELDFPDDPDWAEDAIIRITLAVARRALSNPDGVESTTLGPFSETTSNASPDVYLTAAEKRDIAKIVGGTSGLWTLGTTRDDSPYAGDLPEFAGDLYLSVEGSELIPFLPIDAGNGL